MNQWPDFEKSKNHSKTESWRVWENKNKEGVEQAYDVQEGRQGEENCQNSKKLSFNGEGYVVKRKRGSGTMSCCVAIAGRRNIELKFWAHI